MLVLLKGSPVSTEELWNFASDHQVSGVIPDQSFNLMRAAD